MSTRNFENDDDLSGLGGNTHHPTATGGSEWGFGNISEGEPDDSVDAAQSRRPSHRPPSLTFPEHNSHRPQHHNTHHQPAARAPNSFLHDLLNPAPQPHRRPAPAALSSTRTESNRQHSQQQEHNTARRGTHGYSISAILDSGDETTPQSNASGGEFVSLEDSSSESDDSDMPTATRARNTGSRNRRGSGAVDLAAATQATSSQQSRRRKRSADEADAEAGRAPRRRRISTERIEEIDLANDEALSAEEEPLQQQQRDAIKQQQSEQDEGPQKIGKRQCIICMEKFTNCTATSCGHFYCHECLTQALMTGEKSSDRGIGTCPVCRKPLSRTNKKKMDVIPIQFMKQSQFTKNQQKRGLAG